MRVDRTTDLYRLGDAESATIDLSAARRASVTASSSSLHYDSAVDQSVYAWKTDRAWANMCRQLIFTFTDGTTRAANFKVVS